MDAELRQVANGFDFKVRSFYKYEINGYLFRTYGKELSMADRIVVSLLSAKEIPRIMEELKQSMNFNSMVQTHQTS